MTYKSKTHIETNKELADLVSILEISDVESSCAICTVMKSKLEMKPSDLFTGDGHSTCKKCVISIAKRKHAFLYMIDYLTRYNKTFFTVAEVKKYLERESAHARTVIYSIAIIVRDLLTAGYVKIYNHRPNGDLYMLTGKKMTKTVASSVKPFVLMKGFGFKDGAKVL